MRYRKQAFIRFNDFHVQLWPNDIQVIEAVRTSPNIRFSWSEPLDFIQESVESVFGRRRTMRPSRFSEEQIIAILKEQEAGAKTAEVCRRHGISDASFYKWKAKYGGLDVSEAKRLKVLEDENAKLKKLLAEAMLDNAMLKDIAAKKW